MPNFKGSGIIVVDKLLKAQKPEIRAAFIKSLTPEEKKCFETVVPIAWVPVEIATALTRKAAALLYPGDPRQLFLLGRARAHENVPGIYKIFFKILNIPAVISNSAKLWTVHHDKGRAFVDSVEKGQACYCVTDYPELPEDFRKGIEGFVYGIVELAGAKNIRTTHIDKNPNEWRWLGQWD